MNIDFPQAKTKPRVSECSSAGNMLVNLALSHRFISRLTYTRCGDMNL